MNQTHYIASDLNSMLDCGRMIAAEVPIPAVIYLQGDMGAGKTTLVKGMANHFDYPNVVTSPTYNLIHEYPCDNAHIAHLDLYRLESAEEIEMLGLFDLISNRSLLLIEWPEKGEGYIPSADYRIQIDQQNLGNEQIGRSIQVTVNH